MLAGGVQRRLPSSNLKLQLKLNISVIWSICKEQVQLSKFQALYGPYHFIIVGVEIPLSCPDMAMTK